jgi:hypothetical protein
MIGTKVIYYFELTKQFLNIFIDMEKKKAWQKFMDEFNSESELIYVYRKLRHAFNREGWTEEDLVRPPYYPTDIMQNFQKFSRLRDELIGELRDYFGTIDHNEFSDYLQSKLKHIDLEIPLKNGDIKRNDSRDEDY